MKTNIPIAVLFFAQFFFACKEKEVIPSDVVAANPPPKIGIITFDKDIKPLLAISCTPCHQPGGGRANTWDTYIKTKTFITGIIERVEKEPNNNGFMPKDGKKMADPDIALLKKWIDDGLLEK